VIGSSTPCCGLALCVASFLGGCAAEHNDALDGPRSRYRYQRTKRLYAASLPRDKDEARRFFSARLHSSCTSAPNYVERPTDRAIVFRLLGSRTGSAGTFTPRLYRRCQTSSSISAQLVYQPPPPDNLATIYKARRAVTQFSLCTSPRWPLLPPHLDFRCGST
jgi:hypothetical protein